MVVLLKHRNSKLEVYLRYNRKAKDGWRFSGAYTPPVKYFAPSHRIVNVGPKTFLAVSGQGNAGSGLSSKVESWLKYSEDDHAGRKVHGTVTHLSAQPESVTVAMTVEFEIMDRAGKQTLVCRRKNSLIYRREAGGIFQLDSRASTATADEVQKFYLDLDSDLTSQEFLAFNREGLEAVATRGDATARAWLSRYLTKSPNSLEAMALKRSLTKQFP